MKISLYKLFIIIIAILISITNYTNASSGMTKSNKKSSVEYTIFNCVKDTFFEVCADNKANKIEIDLKKLKKINENTIKEVVKKYDKVSNYRFTYDGVQTNRILLINKDYGFLITFTYDKKKNEITSFIHSKVTGIELVRELLERTTYKSLDELKNKALTTLNNKNYFSISTYMNFKKSTCELNKDSDSSLTCSREIKYSFDDYITGKIIKVNGVYLFYKVSNYIKWF